MVVDDNSTSRRILEELLTVWGMKPQAVAGAREALLNLEAAATAGEPLPVVLLDANMPEMDGFALAAALKKQPGLAGAWIMMLSSARPGARARAQSLGVAADVTKPISQPDLLRAITTALGSPPERSKAPDETDSRHAVRRLRVLVAEDNVVNQLVAVGMLESAGHTASVVENGKQALAALERESFDLLLIDLQMPELDGFEATAAIRKKERTSGRHLAIVAVTAHAMRADAERCFAAGADGFLTKPIDGPRLFDAIKAAMQGKRARSGVAAAGSSGEAVDAERLLARVGGDGKALAGLISVFLADYPKLLSGIRQAVERHDPPELRAAAHKLKGAVANFAAPAATEAAHLLQELGEAEMPIQAAAALASLEAGMARVDTALRAMAPRRKRAAKKAKTAGRASAGSKKAPRRKTGTKR